MDLAELLESSGAVQRGHFLLSSGRHSDVYLEKFRILERPDVLSALCAELASHFRDLGIDIVAGPTTGGIIIAFEVARQLGTPALYVETEEGRKTLRRGASVAPGSRVLVVDDVFTTGLSVRETVTALEERGAEVVGVGVLIDRSEQDPGFRFPFKSAHKVTARSYPPDAVPEWLAEVPLTKPGTRSHP